MAFPEEGLAVLIYSAIIDFGEPRQLRGQVEFDYGQYFLKGLPAPHPNDPTITVTVSTGSRLDPRFLRQSEEERGAYTYSQVVQLHTLHGDTPPQ